MTPDGTADTARTNRRVQPSTSTTNGSAAGVRSRGPQPRPATIDGHAGPGMRVVRVVLAVNGVVFLVRAGLNLIRPSSFYLAAGAPAYAMDAVRVLGISYATLALIQLGAARLTDARAVRMVCAASMLFAAAVAAQACLQGPGTTDAFHRLRWGSAAENALVASLYAVLLYRSRRNAVIAVIAVIAVNGVTAQTPARHEKDTGSAPIP